MAQKTGIYGVMVEDWLGSLPVIVKDKKSGKINKEETYRLNKNNKLFRDASERNSFTLGKLANFLYEITGTDKTARITRAAKKTQKIRSAAAKKKAADKKAADKKKKVAANKGSRETLITKGQKAYDKGQKGYQYFLNDRGVKKAKGGYVKKYAKGGGVRKVRS